MKTGVKIISLLLVALIVLGMLSGILVTLASAAPTELNVITGDTKLLNNKGAALGAGTFVSGRMSSEFTLVFHFRAGKDLSGLTAAQYSISANGTFTWSSETVFTITPKDSYYEGRITHLVYTGDTGKTITVNINTDEPYEAILNIPVPNTYFRKETASSDDDDEDEVLPVSDIVVESVTVKSGSGAVLEKVDKDTPPFTVEIVYSDIGLKDESFRDLKTNGLHTYITNAGGIKTLSGTSGTLTLVSTNTTYPRFRAVFKNLQTDGAGTSLAFRVQYDLADYSKSVKGEATAAIYQINKSEEEESSEIAPLRPNVIVQEYSYGDVPIIAGEEFNLDVTFANTSKNVAVENVVMTIEPSNGFVIAAASNTVYFTSMQPGATVPYAIALRPMPAGNTAAESTDYSVMVKFTYQYLSKKEYLEGSSNVKIAIPVAQLDRFGVDAITDYSQYLSVGEEGYLSVPITNKGKSLTYNITGSVRALGGSTTDFVAPKAQFGNLEAGKSGNVDLSVVFNAPGIFKGEAVIQYEDENMKQKELTVPFEIMVNEISSPPPDMLPDMNAGMPAQGSALFSAIMCIAGSILLAVPIALYIIKRVKAKGSEDLDEDF